MQEAKAIVQAYDAANAIGEACALATVVQVQGSSYRRPGARMLVTASGQMTGAISGGCLEGDALRKAALAMSQGKNKLVIYDTTDEDDAKIGIQLGCNGIVSILFEPLLDQSPKSIEALRKTLLLRSPQWVCTAFSTEGNTHFGTMDLPTLIANLEDTAVQQLLSAYIEQNASAHMVTAIGQEQQSIFLDYCLPPISLIIVGAGNDALPLVQMAAILGWDNSIVDGRVTHANPQRFPSIQSILVGKPAEVLSNLHPDHRTAIVLMTHNYQYDLEIVKGLLPLDFPYLGLLGPAAKRDRLLAEIASDGLLFQEEQLAKLYGPTGLDLGAETANQIALSICSEIMAVIHEKDPMHLKHKSSPIHSNL